MHQSNCFMQFSSGHPTASINLRVHVRTCVDCIPEVWHGHIHTHTHIHTPGFHPEFSVWSGRGVAILQTISWVLWRGSCYGPGPMWSWLPLLCVHGYYLIIAECISARQLHVHNPATKHLYVCMCAWFHPGGLLLHHAPKTGDHGPASS